MTLEEIYKKMKQNNPYYEGSQAQKEEQAGMNIEGDTVKHTEKSAQIHQDYVENQPAFNTFITGAPTYKEQLKDNFIQIKRRKKNLGKNFISGVGNGIRGIMDVPFQETENNLKKGENSNKNLWQHILKSTAYTLNPNVSFIDNIISSNKNATNILKDKNKSDYEKVANIVTNGVTDVVDASTTGKKGLDASIELLGKLSQNNSEKLSDKVQNVQNKVDEPFKKYDEKVQKDNNKFGNVENFLFNVSNSLGNMVPSIVASAVTKNPNIGLATMGYSVKGQSTEEAREKGQELQKAIDIGNTKGAIEAGTELLTGGINFFGKGALDDIAKRGIDNKVKNQVLNFIAKKGYDFAGEIGEETVSDILNTMLDKGTTDPNINYSIKDWSDTALSTLLSTAVLNTIGGGYTKKAYNENVQELKKNNINEEISATGSNKNSVNQFGTEISSTNSIISKNQKKSTQVQISPLNEQTQIKYDSKNFAKQIDEVKNGVFPKNNTLVLLKNTPKVLKDIGLNDLPITMTQKHLETISQDKGRYKNANYHNLGIDVVKQLPEAIANPLNIYKSSTRDDSIVLVTHLSDKKGNIVLASIKVDGKGTINGIVVDANHMTSAYGKNNYDYNIDKKTGEYKPGWAELNKDNMIYDIDEGIIKKNISSMARFQLPRYTTNDSINNIIPQNENYASSNQKVLNPAEISNLTQEDVTTTPRLPNITYKTDKGNNSKFYNNLMNKTGMLNEDLRKIIKNQDDIKYYEGVTNVQSLREANERLQKDGSKETLRWFSKDLSDKNTTVSATEVAEGWILLKQYQDSGDYKSAVSVAKRMRDMATKSGQALQAYSIQARLTPEGMFQYAQSELQDAFERFSKNKTQEWINEHRQDFELKPEETQAIIEKVKEAQQLEDNSSEKKAKLAEIKKIAQQLEDNSSEKKAKLAEIKKIAQELENNSSEKKRKLAEIQKIMTDKLPPERGAGIKSWMRISMLFNPKTQVRNISGNAVVAPVNAVGDVFSTIADKAISRKTGVRTTGLSNPVSNIKGFKKGLYESYNDFKKGLNTRDMEGNKFEIGQGKSFKDKGLGKALNKIDSILNFALDVGDRPFYEATFTNSINNQLVLNNTDIVTQDMIDIATNEALSRTWQDNNNYTKFVLSTRNALNKVNVKGYGLGDILIPFAKTPANLTKAIVDYSPIGLVNTLVEGNNVRKAIGRGDLTAQQQHKFVQDLGKATAGSMIYILGYALAKAEITSGESDDDKDIANFMKNTLGTTQYSVKIGNKSFTYDWAQPVAAPFSMMANLVNKSNKEANLLEKITSTLNVPLNNILEQSFMQSINTVLTNNSGPADGLFEAVSELPSRAIPTLMKQIVDMTDSTQRTTYEKGKPIETAVNKVKAKVPGLSKQLTPVSDTLGNDIKKYGGETNPFLYAFHTFINPANVNSGKGGKVATEIYKIYQKTGDKTIFPRQAGYSQTIDGNNITLTSQERYEYQKTTGKYVNKVVNELLKNKTYKKLKDSEKAKILTEIASDSNEIAKEKLAKEKNLKYERPDTDVKIDDLVSKGLEYGNAYIYKTQVNSIKGNKKGDKAISGSANAKKAKYIINMDANDNQKNMMLSLLTDTDVKPNVSDLKKLNGNYLTYMQQSGKRNDKGISEREKYMMYIDAGIPVNTLNDFYSKIGKIEGKKNSSGKTISGSKKKAIFNYINSLSLSSTQKKILFTKCNSSYGKNYKSEIHTYINNLKISKERKEQIWNELYK